MGISKRIRPRSKRLGHHKYTDETPERIKENVVIPDAVPYSHPASEFVYGTAAVEAALRCSKRQFYKLYIYQSKHEELSPQKVSLRKLALLKNIQVKMAFSEWETLLNTMSGGRPHNGLVLEASQLPQTPTQALKPVQLGEDQFRLELASQTREEAAVNGSNDTIPMNRSFTQQHDRYPVILLLSGITDPGNVGAAIRSAYYLGADAVVFAGPNSAPLSTVAIKASAGAAENMTILRVFNEVDFIQRSQANGWRFYAADALSPGATYVDSASIHNNPPTATTSAPGEGGREGEQDHEYPINHAPSVIMLGHEGTGLSMHIKSQADAVVSIPGARLAPGMGVSSDPARVDSLNVSVAAALLIQMFMGGPLGVGPNLKGRKKKVVPNNEKPA
ncbi:Alpha/beta knot methyltransferase [Aspergillus oleicola]